VREWDWCRASDVGAVGNRWCKPFGTAMTSRRPVLLPHRDGAYAKQQQVATRINKLDPCARHCWWVVLSVMLQ
jgi:hypothetical protein